MFSWTGFYVGLNGGYGWGHDPVTFSPANAAAASLLRRRRGPRQRHHQSGTGGLFGGQIGYNYQWSNFVAGVETDFDWADIQGYRSRLAQLRPASLRSRPPPQQKLTSLGTFRGRVGVAADQRAVLRHRRLGLWPHPAQHLGHHADHRLRPGRVSAPLRRRRNGRPAGPLAPVSNTPLPQDGAAGSNICTTISAPTLRDNSILRTRRRSRYSTRRRRSAATSSAAASTTASAAEPNLHGAISAMGPRQLPGPFLLLAVSRQ